MLLLLGRLCLDFVVFALLTLCFLIQCGEDHSDVAVQHSHLLSSTYTHTYMYTINETLLFTKGKDILSNLHWEVTGRIELSLRKVSKVGAGCDFKLDIKLIQGYTLIKASAGNSYGFSSSLLG